MVYGLMALGLSVVFGVVRIINFAHGEIMLLGIYLVILLNKYLGLDPLLVTPFAAASLFVFGYFLQSNLINRLLDKPEHVQFVILASIALILMNLQLVIFGPDAQTVVVNYSLDSVSMGSILLDKVRLFAAFGALITAFSLLLLFKYTNLGVAIRAAADNKLGSMVVGLNHYRLYSLSFAIGCFCVGIAGGLLSLLLDVTPHLAPQFTLLSFVIVIIGGLGSMTGSILGGVLIGLIETYAGYFTVSSMKSLFSFIFLILILLFRPQGLLAQR